MSIDYLLTLLEHYGTYVIFICLFFGVVGIPAPEETLLVFIGILIHQQAIPGSTTIAAALLGVFCGLIFSYIVGRYAGAPVFYKVTRLMKLKDEKVQDFLEKYEKNYKKALIIGLFIPGARQVNPYFAGISRIPVAPYIWLSIAGTFIWVVPFTLLGYLTANIIDIPYQFLPLIGIGIGAIFILYFWLKRKRGN